MRGGERNGAGRKAKLEPCPTCGAQLSARERRQHKCPRLFAKPIGRPRKGVPARSLVIPQESAYVQRQRERRALVDFITAYRAEQGVGGSARVLSNRSLTQLRKMREQIEKGDTYRQGRRWTQGAAV